MLKEEKELLTRFGREDHFKVPEGYFDEAIQRIDSLLPSSKPALRIAGGTQATIVSRRRLRKAVIGVAASVCVAVMALAGYLNAGQKSQTPVSASIGQEQLQEEDNTNIDAMVDYTMTDTEDMYAYMAY